MKRRYLIGLDEAGYGPNLGPLVIGASVWSLPETDPNEALWTKLSSVVTNQPARRETRLHVADSKEVYSSSKGLASLEKSVLSFHRAASSIGASSDTISSGDPLSWLQLVEHCQQCIPTAFAQQPWYQQRNFDLPLQNSAREVGQWGERLQANLATTDLRLERMAAEVVCPERFNDLVDHYGNKSEVLTHQTLKLLQRIWPQAPGRVEVLADKHGGRNRYQNFLLEYFPDHFVMIEKETQTESRYRMGTTTFAFAMRSEQHFPVALASMLAKYLRELCMELFNQYWQKQLPGLKPTKGYPQDARRFRQEIADLLAPQPQLERILWRTR